MNYSHQDIADVAVVLTERVATSDDPRSLLRAPEIKELYGKLRDLPDEERAGYGQELNQLKDELEQKIAEKEHSGSGPVEPIDVTAPFDVNVPKNKRPELLPVEQGSKHPITAELEKVTDIFQRMGFVIAESRQLDDEYHMFSSLNFPAGHPARDDYDTFLTVEEDANGHPLIAPAHTSIMQNRVLKKYKQNLEEGRPIAVLIPGRVFRNEDLDPRHEHTFYQHEGVFVGKGVTVGMLIATLSRFFREYYQKDIDSRIQPFYFPFTEPSFEFAGSCIFCNKQGCNVCSYSGWIELAGCGMIHPNVLKEAGIDPNTYTGFAWGCGVERPIMLKYGIEDIRHFESGRLEFLRQFS